MRKTLCALVLVLALCGPALAGDITNPPAPAIGDVTDSSGATQSSDDQIADVLAEAALNVLQHMLALL